MIRKATTQLLTANAEAAVERASYSTVTLRFGEVTAVDGATSTLTCTSDGVTLRKVPYLASYSPAVSDTVWLLHQNSLIVAIGAS